MRIILALMMALWCVPAMAAKQTIGDLYVVNNVGIGTSVPTRTLDVVGTANISGAVGLGTTTVTGNATVSGNVGIGSTAPRQKLDVAGGIQVDGSIYLKSPDGTFAYCTVDNSNVFGCIGL